MAHVVDLMIRPTEATGMSTRVVRATSTSPPPRVASPANEHEKHVWRMQQQASESRRYQLFPSSKSHRNAEMDVNISLLSNPAEKDRLSGVSRVRPKEPSLVRRRKISVPELGLMTTVQEVVMDSPTIPGRPAVHERSISAPGYSWKNSTFGESMLSLIREPTGDESTDTPSHEQHRDEPAHQTEPDHGPKPRAKPRAMSDSPNEGLSSRSLTPLIIPSIISAPPQRILHYMSSTKARSSSNPPDVPPKSARWSEKSPYGRWSPFTPSSAAPTTAPTTVSNTPVSEGRSSPKPWATHSERSSPVSRPWVVSLSGRMSPKQILISATGRSSPRLKRVNSARIAAPTPLTGASSTMASKSIDSFGPYMQHRRHGSDTTRQPASGHGHRRHESETSIIDRGRPKKRSESAHSPRPSPVTRTNSKRAQRSPAQAAELIKAFETLPSGHLATHAHSLLSGSEVEALRVQALGQASRFEVLQSCDVETLSRELRGLDERCDYLRKTHQSLRAGRRNLHERICTYLRSPRTAKFSHESLLKQEEALSELDASIDDWVTKLEQAENRRIRVRQKLLEHVAGALIMMPHEGMDRKPPMGIQGENTPPRSPVLAPTVVESRSQEFTEDHGRANYTPRAEHTTDAQVTVPQLPNNSSAPAMASDAKRDNVESIRIYYADTDVYALMADVEEEINRMGEQQQAGKIDDSR